MIKFTKITANLSFIGAFLFILLLILLHFLEPEFNPSWRMISEYALGKYGWMMRLAFISLSLSIFSSLAMIFPYDKSAGCHIGLVLFAVVGVALICAAIFTTDPITIEKDKATIFGNLHNLCAYIVILGFPIAVTLIGKYLPRMQIFTTMQNRLPWMASLVWFGLIIFVVSMIIFMQGKSKLGPDVLIGWPNRFMMTTYAAWLMIIALWKK